jgi:hypothetical protein
MYYQFNELMIEEVHRILIAGSLDKVVIIQLCIQITPSSPHVSLHLEHSHQSSQDCNYDLISS